MKLIPSVYVLVIMLFSGTVGNAAVIKTMKGELTWYCACKVCCGKTDGITASGLKVKNGQSCPAIVACNWLDFGTKVIIGGTIYTVADRGGKDLSRIGRFDIYTPNGHDYALKQGRKKNITVIIVEKK